MIMDDLKEVWRHSLSCLHTIPYYFFLENLKEKIIISETKVVYG